MVTLDGLPFSLRQVDYVVNSDAFVNLASGSIRAGKTISGLLRAMLGFTQSTRHGDLVVCGKTYDTLARNVFNPLKDQRLWGKLARGISYTRGAPTAKVFDRLVEVITFNDERAEARLRGATVERAYVDEHSLMPESFHEQLIGRCSVDGAQIYSNTNPDNPRHWLKANHMDHAGPGGRLENDWKIWTFTLDDNPSLSERVKERYRRQYTGLWYKRMILGQWTMAEGAVYDMWDPSIHVVHELPPIVRWLGVGIDYGTANPTVALLLGLGSDGRLYLTHEWRWASREQGRQLTDAEYSRRIREWMRELHVEPEYLIVDPSAASFIRQLYQDGARPMAGNNAVLDGIRVVSSLLATDRLRVHERCTGFISEMPAYVWDAKAALDGRDEPVKRDDHSLDGGRYVVKTTQAIWRNLLRDY